MADDKDYQFPFCSEMGGNTLQSKYFLNVLKNSDLLVASRTYFSVNNDCKGWQYLNEFIDLLTNDKVRLSSERSSKAVDRSGVLDEEELYELNNFIADVENRCKEKIKCISCHNIHKFCYPNIIAHARKYAEIGNISAQFFLGLVLDPNVNYENLDKSIKNKE